MVGKAGLDVDSRLYCEMEKAMFRSSKHPSRMFGMDMSVDHSLRSKFPTWRIALKVINPQKE